MSLCRCPDVEVFLQNLRTFLEDRQKAEHTYFEELDREIDEKMEFLNDQIKNFENLTEKFNSLLEYKYVLTKTREILGDREDFTAKSMNDVDQGALDESSHSLLHEHRVTGDEARD